MKKVVKHTASTAVAVIHGANVIDSLEQIDAKLKSLKHITDSTYRTSMNLPGFGDLKQETKIDVLLRALSMVNGKEKAYNEAASLVDLPSYPAFTEGGGNTKDWIQDIKLRIAIINSKETHDKLQEYKTKMSTFLSQQDQKNMLEQEMNSFLKGLGQ